MPLTSVDLTRLIDGTGGPVVGSKNKIINGGMAVDQRNAGAAQTFTAAAALAYSVDRWYGYCTGANVTGQRVAGTSNNQYRYQFTGAASVTGIGFAQRIESINCYDLAGTTATLSVDLSNSLLTSVTWTAYYANSADAFGSLASPTKTQIATGTFTVSNSISRYSAQISIPAAATTGVEIVFTVGAQTSGTWVIGNVQLESGIGSTPFERRNFGQELALAQRYYQTHNISQAAYGATGNSIYYSVHFPIMRTTPTAVITTAPSYTNASNLSPVPTGAADIYYAFAITSTGAGVASNAGVSLSAEL